MLGNYLTQIRGKAGSLHIVIMTVITTGGGRASMNRTGRGGE